MKICDAGCRSGLMDSIESGCQNRWPNGHDGERTGSRENLRMMENRVQDLEDGLIDVKNGLANIKEELKSVKNETQRINLRQDWGGGFPQDCGKTSLFMVEQGRARGWSMTMRLVGILYCSGIDSMRSAPPHIQYPQNAETGIQH